MCGIAGFYAPYMDSDIDAVLNTMLESILTRGPDETSTFVDHVCSVALGHTRLAIRDLSSAGSQPMFSEDRNFVIVFNGELYNTNELLNKLASIEDIVSLNGTSDTEVLLRSLVLIGVEQTLKLINGMFAFVLWDRARNLFFLARDRFGIKPLYYREDTKSLAFSSTLGSLITAKVPKEDLDPRAICDYLHLGYLSSGSSLVRGIKKVLPGELLVFSGSKRIGSFKYYSVQRHACGGRRSAKGSTQDWLDLIDVSLSDAVKRTMTSVGPVGGFLSGGIDSSVIATFLQAQSSSPVDTFTLGVRGIDDESPHARAIAGYLGTNHHELSVGPSDFLNILSDLPEVYDEPFSDSSQLPTFLICREASRHVKVALSGDGADELFAGYPRHVWGSKVYRYLKIIKPLLTEKTRARISQVAMPEPFDTTTPLFSKGKLNRLFDIYYRTVQSLSCSSIDEVYSRLVRVCGPRLMSNALTEDLGRRDLTFEYCHAKSDPIFALQLMDLSLYLPDDILVKVDRAAGANGLEVRVPYLDNNLVELCLDLPSNLRIRGRVQKWILKKVLSKYLPQELHDRPKKGFGIPIDSWLRNEFREWAESLLDERALKRFEILDSRKVRALWDMHLSGTFDLSTQIWTILMFQGWLNRWTR